MRQPRDQVEEETTTTCRGKDRGGGGVMELRNQGRAAGTSRERTPDHRSNTAVAGDAAQSRESGRNSLVSPFLLPSSFMPVPPVGRI